MRAAFRERGVRAALVTPAFERLVRRTPEGRVAKDGAGQPLPQPWGGGCEAGSGCEMLQGMAMPRTFGMLREMLQAVGVVDIFPSLDCALPHNAVR